MKFMIFGNNEKYDNEFKKEEDYNFKEMEKIFKGVKDENVFKFYKKEYDDYGGGY